MLCGYISIMNKNYIEYAFFAQIDLHATEMEARHRALHSR